MGLRRPRPGGVLAQKIFAIVQLTVSGPGPTSGAPLAVGKGEC
jgi:hypothetical protein